MKRNNGFTLIEMLVVVAMVGVLAAATLTALGPSRKKAKDSRIISGLNQIAAVAETTFDGSAYATSLSGAGSATVDAYNSINSDITSMGGQLVYRASGNKFIVFSRLATNSSQAYCVDSKGSRLTLTSIPGANVFSCGETATGGGGGIILNGTSTDEQ